MAVEVAGHEPPAMEIEQHRIEPAEQPRRPVEAHRQVGFAACELGVLGADPIVGQIPLLTGEDRSDGVCRLRHPARTFRTGEFEWRGTQLLEHVEHVLDVAIEPIAWTATDQFRQPADAVARMFRCHVAHAAASLLSGQ